MTDEPPVTPDRPETPETDDLRRRLRRSEGQVDSLRSRARDLERQLSTAGRNNRRMAELLEVTRGEMTELRAALHADGQAPFTFGTVIGYRPGHDPVDGREIEAAAAAGVDILHSGRKMRVSVSPLLDVEHLHAGTEVLLNENLTVVAALGSDRTGEIARVREVLDDERLLVLTRGEDERLVRLSGTAEGTGRPVRIGDAVTVDLRTGTATEVIRLSEVDDVVLEETPDVSYADIGGLSGQIEQIRDAVELPFLHADLYREHGLRAPKGILLYGPPGCGKTMIAKAVAASLESRRTERAGEGGAVGPRSFFLNIKGPELLNKYVGETERHIRLIFSHARERATAGHPVVVFFDEMEALFRTRGSGVSSDVETTIVPQLLAEIDGVESLDNVIVIGASNREDMIDPAILRPGRLDVKIRVQRPGSEGAREILGIHLGQDLPLRDADVAAEGRDQARRMLVDAAVDAVFPRDGRARLRLRHADGSTTQFRASDFVSGAVLSNVVDRAKKTAIKDFLASGEDPAHKGVTVAHVRAAVEEEMRDQEDLVNTADPQEWARVIGASAAPVVSVEHLARQEGGA
ncbi:MAG: proteasome ATPase [Nesterenkonia sp.]|uniref:proteasome ATPase n=1 Tax=Nesterenkonia marinintestina TaxID=2979865 RepID=UPI0021BE2ABB|nr:proteasome ATPase [Nesterenkonia sp. GX14115]MDO5492109.1 proteasome ATPase [Nesterenkonia sp.]